MRPTRFVSAQLLSVHKRSSQLFAAQFVSFLLLARSALNVCSLFPVASSISGRYINYCHSNCWRANVHLAVPLTQCVHWVAARASLQLATFCGLRSASICGGRLGHVIVQPTASMLCGKSQSVAFACLIDKSRRCINTAMINC